MLTGGKIQSGIESRRRCPWHLIVANSFRMFFGLACDGIMINLSFLQKMYTLRQKFSIIICLNGGKNIWLELIPVYNDSDTIVLI